MNNEYKKRGNHWDRIKFKVSGSSDRINSEFKCSVLYFAVFGYKFHHCGLGFQLQIRRDAQISHNKRLYTFSSIIPFTHLMHVFVSFGVFFLLHFFFSEHEENKPAGFTHNCIWNNLLYIIVLCRANFILIIQYPISLPNGRFSTLKVYSERGVNY